MDLRATTGSPPGLLLTRLPGEDPAWEWRVGYDDEPHANKGDTVALTEGGRLLDGELVMERAALPSGELRLVTEVDGEDDHKPARVRHIYLLAARSLSLQKLVRFAGTDAFFERHIYRWTR